VEKIAALALALVALAAGCGGDDDSASPTTGGAPQAEQYADDPKARQTLDEFVQAAGRRDAAEMYSLLTETSRAKFGPTLASFRSGAGRDLSVVLGAMARDGGGYEHVLAQQVTAAWSVAAIQGHVSANGEDQYGAYAVALRRLGDERRVELAAPVSFNPVTPEPELKSESTPDIATEVTADEPILRSVVWVDDRALVSNLGPEQVILSAEVTTPLPDGRHTVVTYAETQDGAGANAFTFQVD
jgi:hypothetical protein